MARQPARSKGGALDDLVDEILRVFALDPRKSLRWRQHLADLTAVLRADYAAIFDDWAARGELPLRELEKRGKSVFPDFNEEPLRFRESVRRIRGDESADLRAHVRLSPYGRECDPLRGFYHYDPERHPLIWVNVRHVPAAIAATLAHEVGHLMWTEIRSEPPATETTGFFNADFARHLEDPGELFADAFATMAAYPRRVAVELFSARGWPRIRGRGDSPPPLDDVHAYLREHYDVELGPSSTLPPLRRMYYVISMIHFSKVRAAVVHTHGL